MATIATGLCVPLALAAAEEEGDAAKKEKPPQPSLYYEVTITATGTETDTFEIPNPVSVLDEQEIREKTPDTVTDLLRGLPGVDVNGVGPNQPRPIIRGQRGQRILLLQDGIRLNNPRRQSDFGELPSLIDTAQVKRVEVVRGPASVLYGSDAIGGVINIVSQRPLETAVAGEVKGSLSYRYSSVDRQNSGNLNVTGLAGKLAYTIGGTYRKASDYDAPSGSFGDIRLKSEVEVRDTGTQDDTLLLRLEYPLQNDGYAFLGVERYRADESGFGYVDPKEYSPGDPTIRIVYPYQVFDQYRAGFELRGLRGVLADRVSVTAFARKNERQLDFNIFIPFGGGAGLNQFQTGVTNVDAIGTRVEAARVAGARHLITYGLDFDRDEAKSRDREVVSFVGFPGPPPEVSTTPTLPKATWRSAGVFAQDDIKITDKFSTILGARYQNVRAETKDTPGLEGEPTFDSKDSATVWAANFLYSVTPSLNLIANVGTAFRSPNLIERFFNGPTPEGSGFQVRNPDLKPEKSFNVDLGFKYRRENVYCELIGFRNKLRDGIRITPADDPSTTVEEFQLTNVDELTYKGIEAVLDWTLTSAFSIGLNYTRVSAKAEGNLNFAASDSYSDKVVLDLRYQHPGNRHWVEYSVRHNGDQTDVELGDNPIGDKYPAFTVHDLRAGAVVWRTRRTTHQVILAIENLTDELYAEFSNASFFRPEPGRNFILNYNAAF